MEQRVSLTEQEIQAAYIAEFDLGRGYPQLALPRYVRKLYGNSAIAANALEVVPAWTREKQLLLDHDLEAAAREFLSIDFGSYFSIRFTFSGSIALDRAIAAATLVASSSESSRVGVITTSPSIDIMKLFLEERRYIDIWFVESRNAEPWGLDAGRVIDRLKALSRDSPRYPVIVLLTSPENPTGQCWTSADLTRIAAACDRVGAVLIVDHSFLVAGVHPRKAVPAIWDVLGQGSNWIAIWDTGKTFGLNEDKIGMVICGSESVGKALDRSLSIIQYATPRRQSLLYATLFRKALRFNYTDYLSQVCRRNLITAEGLLGDAEIELLKPAAGSLALIKIAEPDDEGVRHQLLMHGVGVISGSVFFHTDWQPCDLLRIALARDPDYFTRALTKLVREIKYRA
jgi:bifunctional pyridoxal-dependent enzyme with beta-cystathionase and maltose regulon repressor activities